MKTARYHLTAVGFWLLVAFSPAFCGTIIEDSFPAGPGGQLTLNTDFGDVFVERASGSEVRVKIVLEPEVEKLVDPTFYLDGYNVTVRARGSKWYKLTACPTGKARFVVSVPDGYRLNLKNRWGDVEIQGASGQAEVKTCRGSITVDSFAGSLELEAAGGGITLGRIDGAVKAKTRGGPIHVEGYKGEISAKTFAGGITFCSKNAAFSNCELCTNGGNITLVRPPALAGSKESDTFEADPKNNRPQCILCSWDGEISVKAAE